MPCNRSCATSSLESAASGSAFSSFLMEIIAPVRMVYRRNGSNLYRSRERAATVPQKSWRWPPLALHLPKPQRDCPNRRRCRNLNRDLLESCIARRQNRVDRGSRRATHCRGRGGRNAGAPVTSVPAGVEGLAGPEPVPHKTAESLGLAATASGTTNEAGSRNGKTG